MDDEPMLQDRQQVKYQQFYAPAQTWQKYSMQGHMVDLKRHRATSGERHFIEHWRPMIKPGKSKRVKNEKIAC